MPIFSGQAVPGARRGPEEFLARSIVDTMSEIAGTGREGVHVIFDEVERADWAIETAARRHTRARARARRRVEWKQ